MSLAGYPETRQKELEWKQTRDSILLLLIPLNIYLSYSSSPNKILKNKTR